MKRRVFRILLFTLLAVGGDKLCQGERKPMLEFEHTAWTQQSGAPPQILALAQTTDGYLWLGTANGLYRFDGVTFELYQLPRGQQFPHSSVQSLAATDDGGLWIGYTLGDIALLSRGVLTVKLFRHHLHKARGTVYSIAVRRDGNVWASTAYGPIHLVSGEWQDAEESRPFDLKSSYSLFEDAKGALWMATDDFAYRLPHGAKQFEKTELNGGPNTTFALAPDGKMWVADQHGVHDISASSNDKSHLPTLKPFKDQANDIRFDDSGAMWIVAEQTGVTRIAYPDEALKLSLAGQQEAFDHYSSVDGLTSERAIASLKDREGNMWVATSDGLDRFRHNALTRAPLPSSFAFYALAVEPSGSVLIGTEEQGLQRLQLGTVSKVSTGNQTRIPTIYRAPDGKLWLGGFGDLGYIENGRYVAVPVPPEVKSPARDTQAMTVGPDGELWMQTVSTHGIMKLHDGQWSEIPNTTSKGPAVVMATDSTGRVWAGYMDGFLTVFDGGRRKVFSTEQGLTVGNVLALYPSPQGMWIGGEHGLEVDRNGQLTPISFAGDAKIEGISGLTRTDDGTLWVNCLLGIMAVPSAEVEQSLANPAHAMRYRLFNYLDGLSGKAPQLRPLPSIVRGVGKTLWFTTTNGVVSLDTARIQTNSLIPPVSIKGIQVDGTTLDANGTVSLPKGAKDLEIDYTALSLSIPERVRFRYRLDGYDKEWQDVGARRQAFYTHLSPGHYAFHVVACNNDGLWNETGATALLYLPPTFLQSAYFKALLIIFCFVVTWMIYSFRMRRETAKVQLRLQERFSERERIARDLHDTLFQSVEGSLLHLNAVTSRLSVEQQVKHQLQKAYAEVDKVMGEARSLIFDLRQPVTSQDLLATIELFAEEVGGLSNVSVEVEQHGHYEDLKPPVYDAVLKITKESIWNAFRHAHPKSIQVKVVYSVRTFEVFVSDDGVGIAPAILEQGAREGHWGLPGIRERAAKLHGNLTITSRTEGGTRVHLEMSAVDAYESNGKSSLFSRLRALTRNHPRLTE